MATFQERKCDSGETHYRVVIRRKGAPQQSATFRRLTDARKWARRVESEIEEGKYFPGQLARRHTLGEAIARYTVEVLPRLAATSRAVYEPRLRWWNECIGSRRLSNITPALVVECRSKLSAAGQSAATVNQYVMALKVVLSVAAKEWQWIDGNPLASLKQLPLPGLRVRFLDDDERRALLEACKASTNPHLYHAVVLALSTGCRKNEIMHLRWPDVDFERGRITLRATKNKETRGVPVSGVALECLRERARIRRIDTDYVFPQDGQAKPTDIDAAFAKARDAAGIQNFKFHDLRHSAASYLAMTGATLAEIAETLGHRSIQMVRRYAHLSETHTAAVVERMTEKIFGEGNGA